MNDYRHVIEKINDTFAKGDTEGFLSYCSENIKWTIVGEKPVIGKDAVRRFMAQGDGCEPPSFTIDAIAAEGDNVAAHGAIAMKDKDGIDSEHRYCDFYRFENGLVSELTSYIVRSYKGDDE